MKKVKQLNRCTIKLDTAQKLNWFGTVINNPNYGKYAVYAPDGRCLEDGLSLGEAIEYCNDTTDFLARANA